MKVALLALLLAAPLAHAESCYLIESKAVTNKKTVNVEWKVVDRQEFDANADAITVKTRGWRLSLNLDRRNNTVDYAFEPRGKLYAQMREAYGSEFRPSSKAIRGAAESSKSLKDVDTLNIVLPVKMVRDGVLNTKAEISCSN